MGGHTKLSSALEDMRERTTEAVNDVAASNKFVRIGKQIDEISKSLGAPKHKPTSMKDRWRRLLERRGDLKEKYKGSEIVKTSEPPPPKGVSLKEWDKILQKQAGKYGKNSAGFDLQGKTEVQGLPIAIENRVGSVREGENDDGSKWRTKFRTPYGYLEGTKGADGDEIDTYVGPDKKSDKAVVVHQKNPDGSHDEDTVMLGYPTAGAAKKDILRHYEDKSQVGGTTVMTVDELKARLARADGKKVEKLAGMASEQASLNFRDGDSPQMTGAPAKLRRRRGEGPSRMGDLYPPAKAENRQDIQQTKQMEGFNTTEGFDDVGKMANAWLLPVEAAALGLIKHNESMGKDRALGDQRKSWEGPTRDSVGRGLPEKHRLQTATGQEAVVLNDISTSVGQDESKTASKAKRLRAGLELAAEEAVRVGHGKSRDREKTASVKLASLEEAMRSAFLEEATKLGYASGLDKLAASPAFDDMVKEAIFKQLAGGLKRGLVGGMSPQGVPMKGMLGGLKGSGGRMAGVGQQMKTSPMQRIQSAGASAGDAQQLAQQAQRFGVKAPGVGKRIAGEAVQGAGQHVQHASKTQMALNPLGTVIGGGIEGGTRGTGKELVRSTGLAGKAGGGGMRAGVGRAMQKHAPKAGLAGEIGTLGALGGLAHVPLSGAGALGTGMAKASPLLAKGLGVLGQVGGHVGADAIGTMAQRAGRLAPMAARALPGALTAMGAHTGRLLGRAA